MSLASVRAFLAEGAPDLAVIETSTSSATVQLAAEAHGAEPNQIAKTLAFRVGDRELLVVAAGLARIDNGKFKRAFGGKARMLDGSDVERLTGHPVGGVSPFGLAEPLRVFCDLSLKAFDEVIPAAGSTNSAVRIAPDRLADLTNAEWVDVCAAPPPEAGS